MQIPEGLELNKLLTIKDTEYHSIKGISSHGIIEYIKSPKKYEHKVINGNNDFKKSYQIGTLLHLSLLEPHRWDSEIGLLPSLAPQSNAFKEAKKAIEEKGKIPVKEEDFVQVQNMKKAVLSHADASLFFFMDNLQTEKSLFWQLEVDNYKPILAKARFDIITDDYIVDLKMTRSIDKRQFFYNCKDYGYLKQAAWYSMALEFHTKKKRRYLLLAVESEAPHEVAIFEVPQSVLEMESEKIASVLPDMVKSIQTGNFANKNKGISPLWMPAGYFEEGTIETEATYDDI